MLLKDRKGVILITCYLVIVILLILGSAFLLRSTSEKRIAEREKNSIQAFYLAEAGIDKIAKELYTTFQGSFPTPIPADFSWFNGLDDAPRSENPAYAGPPINALLGEGTYSVVLPVGGVSVDTLTGQADVTLESSGNVNNITRTVRSVIRYSLEPSRVFEYAYFVNNFGWFWGGGITGNGDIRSNGDFSFGGNPTVNGDIYASTNPDLGANGDITGNSMNKTIAQYRNQADDEARPTDPTADPQDIDGDGIDEEFPYPDGYGGNSERFPNQEVLEMPYLGNLQSYRNLAVSEGGTISQGGAVLVNAVYGDEAAEAGPDGVSGTPDDDCVVLNGTAANPIVISGPVVVEGDVIIRGVVRGQGIIYSGRNTHIIGDITYETPPAWPKPDTNPSATDTVNETRTFLGLASKGNVIIGDYTRNDWKTNVTNYLKPPFTQAYDIDHTDAVNGYDTDGYFDGEGTYVCRFDGNYTNNDGGVKDNGAGGSTNRRYYESSLSDDLVNSISAPSNQIRRIDAVSYTNHAFSGRVGALDVNGTIVCRDEAIVYSGSITMNYDLRAKTKGQDFNLPRVLALPQIISWEEN